ncbi:hypothetical protein ES288_1Z029700v1 [Gossypium darwinii]|uniref:Uncharacterized protein n=1 Tax=Gossypium darwinii TaxID=34276 RepID=A0A5C7J0Q7_GOSDA|nr:hypothetical protein ES288_1Z029700v1 [Gossypium darwinii]
MERTETPLELSPLRNSIISVFSLYLPTYSTTPSNVIHIVSQVLEILQPFLHTHVLDLLLLCIVQHCLDIRQYGLPLLELLVELLMISNKVERRVERFAHQQVQEPRKSSLSNDRHGGIMRKKMKREMNKPKWKVREQKKKEREMESAKLMKLKNLALFFIHPIIQTMSWEIEGLG